MGANSSRPDGVGETSSLDYPITSKIGLEAKNEGTQTDVVVKYDGEIVSHSHRLVLSAFSRRFKDDLLAKQQLPLITLDYNSNTGISKEALKELIDYCSTGQYKISQSLFDAAKYLQCENLIQLLENAIEAPSSSSAINDTLTDPRHAANFLEALCQMRIDNEFVETADPIQEAPSSSSTVNETLTDHRQAINFLEALCQMKQDGEFIDANTIQEDSEHKTVLNSRIAQIEGELKLKLAEFGDVKVPASDPGELKCAKAILRHLLLGSKPRAKFDPYKNVFKLIALDPDLCKRVSEAYGGLNKRFLDELKSMWESWKRDSNARKEDLNRRQTESLREKNIRITQIEGELKLKLDEIQILKQQVGGIECERQKIHMEYALNLKLVDVEKLKRDLESEETKWRLSSDAKKAEFDLFQRESQREKIIRINQIECELKLKLAEIQTYKKSEGDLFGLTKKTKNTEEIEEIKKIEEFLAEVKLIMVERRDMYRCGAELMDSPAIRKHKAQSTSSEIKRRKYDNCEMKMYQCHLCGKQYADTAKMVQHMMEEHTERIQYQYDNCEMEMYQCRVCEKKYAGRPSMMDHMMTHHTGTASGLVRPDGKRESDPRWENINIKKRKIVLERNNLSEGMDENTIIDVLHKLHFREKNHLKKLHLTIKSSGIELTLNEPTTTLFYRYQFRDIDQLEQALRNLISNTFVEEIRILLGEEPNEQCIRLIDTIFHIKCARLIVDKFDERVLQLNTPQATLSTLLALENDHSGYTNDDRNETISPSLSGQDLVELKERELNIPQVTRSTIVTLAENTRDVRINAICPSLTAQDLFRLREIMWEGDCNLKYFSVKVANGMDKSFLNECYGVTMEERVDTPRFKIYRTEDKFTKLWYREDVFHELYHFEGNLKTTIGSELFVSEKIEGGATPDEGFKKIVWNHRYEEGSIDVEGVDDDDDEDSIIDVDDSLVPRVKMNARSAGRFAFEKEKESELEMSKLELAEIKIRKVIEVLTVMKTVIESEAIDTIMPGLRLDPVLPDSSMNGHMRRRHQPDGASAIVYDDKTAPEKERFQCSACGYASAYKKSVQTHIRSLHTGERPFKCRHCGKTESSQSNLSRHERSHTQQKPYKCLVENCGREYADRKNIERHMWTEHVKQGQCQCTSLPVYTSSFKRNDQPLKPVPTKMRCTLHSEEQQGSARSRPLMGL